MIPSRLGTWIVLPLLLSGCGLARVYNKIELGQPLPADLGLTEVIDKYAAKDEDASQERLFKLSEYYVWHTPLTTSLHRLAVLIDAEGKVTARMHDTTTVTNLLVAMGSSSTHTMEVQIPAELAENPKGATIDDVIPRYQTWWVIDPNISPSARKALILTGNGRGYECVSLYALLMFDCVTCSYTGSIPLSSVLEPGYRETILVHSTGFVTLTNLGDNRLRIETSTWLVTDPTGMSGFLSLQLLGTFQIPAHYDQ
jgi:hypothetical protein